MRYTSEGIAQRPRPDEQMDALFSDGFPAFITADQEVKKYIGHVRDLFTDLQLVLLDEEEIVAAAWGVPIAWNGNVVDLPGGYTDALRRAVEEHGSGLRPDTFVIMAAQVHPGRRGQGIAAAALSALRDLAEERGWARVIAPVRPTLKSRYPLTSIDRFATWTREDGSALDPWLRTHQRLGAQIIGTAPASQEMSGTVKDWQGWTGLDLPETGTYVIPEGLAVLHLDVEADSGIYVEPNVWMQHS
jgi:GNAT superfamily N-acetyltransferase